VRSLKVAKSFDFMVKDAIDAGLDPPSLWFLTGTYRPEGFDGLSDEATLARLKVDWRAFQQGLTRSAIWTVPTVSRTRDKKGREAFKAPALPGFRYIIPPRGPAPAIPKGARKVHYVAVSERGEQRGRCHMHAVMALPPDLPLGALFALWPHGKLEVSRVANGFDAARYVCDYLKPGALRIGISRTSKGLFDHLVLDLCPPELPREKRERPRYVDWAALHAEGLHGDAWLDAMLQFASTKGTLDAHPHPGPCPVPLPPLRR
jgi:hypothetical protein